MRVLLDEDSPVQLMDVLRHILPKHDVHHVTRLPGWSGKKDRSVYADAKRRGYHVIVTNDNGQLDNPVECDAIKKAGVHHVRYTQRRRGMEGLALALGAVIASMPSIMSNLEAENGQRLVRVKGIDPHGRSEMIDPIATPPKYWKR